MFSKYKKSGFTIIEVLVAVVLVGILLGPIAMLYNTGFQVFYSQWTRSGIKSETGRSLALFSYDLRQATSLVSAQAAALNFTSDCNSDGIDEVISYNWSGVNNTPWNRIVVSPSPSSTTTLVNSVNALDFSYYDVNNNILSFPVNVSLVKMVGVNISARDKDESFFLTSKTYLRNL